MLHFPAAAFGAVLCLAVPFQSPAQARNVRECQGLTQRYEQIKATAGSIERNSLLFSAANFNCVALAGQVLKDGASLDVRDRVGNKPLAKAAKRGSLESVKLFLAAKPDVNARNLEASTALFLAVEEEHLAIAELLLAAGADPNLPGRTGIPPVAAAAYTGNIKLVQLLIEKGADARAPDATGKTAIIYAAGRAYTAVVRLLVERGIEINLRYAHDLTALMWAAGHSEEAGAADVQETIGLLVEKGAGIDEVDDRGRTALMIAAELGRATAVEALIKAGADRTLTDKTGKSAGDLASNERVKTALTAH